MNKINDSDKSYNHRSYLDISRDVVHSCKKVFLQSFNLIIYIAYNKILNESTSQQSENNFQDSENTFPVLYSTKRSLLDYMNDKQSYEVQNWYRK